jgi:peptidoglycan/LPS O-acetylase OafA/YrhL
MPSSREPAFDALRAAMLLSLLALHAAVPYMTTPLGALWPIQDRSTHFAFDILVAFLHTFRIPLLFFVAGYFAASLYLRRGAKAFVVHRSRRIALPLVAAWLVTAPLTIAAFRAGAATGRAPDASPASLPLAQIAGQLQWFHLWFLFDLLLYYAAACALVPLVRRLPERAKDRGLRAVDAFYRHPWAPLLAAPLTALTLLPMTSGMLETPGSFARPPATLLANGVFVLAGWGLYLRREVVAALPARAWSRVLWGVVLFAGWLALLVRLEAGEARAHLPAIALLAAACWFLVLGLAGVFVRHFARPRAATRHLADASYWCYLAHLPVVVWCAVGLAGIDWPGGVKYALVLLATTTACLGTYALGMRALHRGSTRATTSASTSTFSSGRASPRAAVAAAAAGSAAGTGGRTPRASPASRRSRG